MCGKFLFKDNIKRKCQIWEKDRREEEIETEKTEDRRICGNLFELTASGNMNFF